MLHPFKLLHLLRSAFDRLVGAMNQIGTLWILVVMVLINTDILGRNLMNRPVQGVNEIVSMSIVGIVFMQLGHTLRSGRFIRSDGLVDVLIAKNPVLFQILERVYGIIGFIIMATIFYFSLPHFLDAWNHNLFVGNVGQFTFPTWPIKLILLIGLAVLAIQFLLTAIDAPRGPANRDQQGEAS